MRNAIQNESKNDTLGLYNMKQMIQYNRVGFDIKY